MFFHILFHYGLSQDIEYSSLCYTVGPCCLSILNVIAFLGESTKMKMIGRSKIYRQPIQERLKKKKRAGISAKEK